MGSGAGSPLQADATSTASQALIVPTPRRYGAARLEHAAIKTTAHRSSDCMPSACAGHANRLPIAVERGVNRV
jgi:hypothetical protein